MSWSDEARLLRHRLEAIGGDIDRLRDPGGDMGSPTFLLRTRTLAAYPTAARSFYACDYLLLDGVEAAGEPVEMAVETGPVFALNLGTRIPPSGTAMVASVADGLHVFQYDGGQA